MKAQNMQAKRTVADKSSALRFTGDEPVHLSGVDGSALNGSFTIEAWVRPVAVERGVVLYPGERLEGSGVAFGPGRYDDLTRFRVGTQAIQSLRVPPDFLAILFNGKGCRGLAYIAEYDEIMLAQEWTETALSLLVIDLKSETNSFAVGFSEPNGEGTAIVLTLQRYETLAGLLPGQTSLASILLPPGLEVTIYDRPRCQGTGLTICEHIRNIAEHTAEIPGWRGEVSSLALTKAAIAAEQRTSTSSTVTRIAQIFGPSSGPGLTLQMEPSSSPVRPPDVLFADTKLRTERWHHIALTFDGTNQIAYINGRVAQTSQPPNPPDLSGDWILGDGFYGDIGLVSLRHGARSLRAMQTKRFDLPESEEAAQPDPADETTLYAGWALDGSEEDPLIEVRSGSATPLSGGDVFWVAAQLPRSVLNSGVGRKALSEAKQRTNEAQQKARQEAQTALDKAHQKAQEKRRAAHAKAQVSAHAARIEEIRAIAGRSLLHLGPDGQDLATPQLPATALLVDLDVDPSTGDTYVAFRNQESGYYEIWRIGQDADGANDPVQLFVMPEIVHALTLNSGGMDGQKHIYWIQDDGNLVGSPAIPGDTLYGLVDALPPGRYREWHMAFDPRNQQLFWSNGREIWRGILTETYQLIDWRVFVSHGRSPYPVALTVDDETGDLFWIDKELEMVRTCDAEGKRIRDLYEALDPREGIELDYIDLTGLSDVDADHPALALKRLYWNAEYRRMIDAAIIDTPGLFCWLQHSGTEARPRNRISALADIHFAGAKWHQWVDQHQVFFSNQNQAMHFYDFYTAEDNKLHALVHRDSENDSRMWWIQDLDTTENAAETILMWHRAGSTTYEQENSPPTRYVANRTGSRFLCDRILLHNVESEEGAMIFEPYPSENWVTLEGHRDIQALAFSADDSLAILGSRDSSLSVWDSESGAWLQSLTGHTDEIQSVSTFAVDGVQYALSGSKDGTIKHWDLADGTCLQTMTGHAKTVMAVATTTDQKRVVSGSADNTLKIWDLASGACLRTLQGHTDAIHDIAIHPDGARAISASSDGTIKVWDIHRGVCLHTFSGHEGAVIRLALADEGRKLLSVGEYLVLEWDIRNDWMLGFDGQAGYVDLGPLFLSCAHGFAVECEIHLENLDNEMTVFSLGNGEDGSNISLTLDTGGELVFAVEEYGDVHRVQTDGSQPVSAGNWHTVSLSVNSVGAATFTVNGQEAGNGLTVLPRTCLRLLNEVGRSNQAQNALLNGKIKVLRLWNRPLTEAEITSFHQKPLSSPKLPTPTYDRSVMEYRNGRPYLMSGMSDGSTPALPMFELAIDKGLAIQSKSTTAHAKLLTAQHDKQAAEEKAAADRASARRAAQARIDDAHAQNQADHTQAQQILNTAQATAAQKRAEAHQRLAVTTQRTQQQINEAKANARLQKVNAQQQAQQIKDNAYRQAEGIKQAANEDLQNAQAERAKYD